ncbi:hypothetical protein [Nostoc sp. C057]|nr:hypothetical protein [Nostoc sp. C057]
MPAETGLSQRTNSLYLGTNVISGTAIAVVVHTGKREVQRAMSTTGYA